MSNISTTSGSSGRVISRSTKVADPLNALLTSPQFSVSSYLNLALSDVNKGNSSSLEDIVPSAQNEDEVQRRLAELALQLQLQTQTCHDEIGRIGAELQAILPRCSADIQRLSVGLEGIRLDAIDIEKDSFSSQDTSLSLETLSTLHSLRLNLSLTKRILSATSSWDSTVSSIPTLLSEQKLLEAVKALTELERGERALRGMPGREDRCAVLQKYRTQMESMLKPQLLHALSNMDSRIGLLQQCVSMYGQLNKMETMQQEYIKFRPEKLQKRWFSFQSSGGAPGIPVEFDLWLRDWLSDVLLLLSQEQSRSGDVFGKNVVTEITGKVLAECFRPLLPSFQSRLSQLYPITEGSNSSSLQSICSAYQCIISFLSEAYNYILPTSLEQQNTVKHIFLTIASPFAPYQKEFPKLELRFSSTSLNQISKNIQQISTISHVTTSSLQDALEKLQSCANYIFEVLQHSINRYSLLQAGYRPADIVETLDILLKTHISELTIAISSLSNAASPAQQQSSNHELYISIVLEVLKVVGGFSKHFTDYEYFCSETFMRLLERMAIWTEIEKKCFLIMEDSSFDTPILLDSLSELDARDLFSKSTLLASKELPEDALAKLQTYVETSTSLQIFTKAHLELSKLSHASHMFLFDTMSSLPFKHLQNMSSLPSWRSEISPDAFQQEDLDLPQPYITQVGEHMLALVQALEPFATDDESLEMVRTIMGGIKYRVATTYWREFMEVLLQDGDDDKMRNELMSSDGISKLHQIMDGHDKSLQSNKEIEEEEEEEEPHVQFCNEWLDVIATAVTGKLMERICRIARLTDKGAGHLSADLNYLVNVLMALGLYNHPHPLLINLAQMDADSVGNGDIIKITLLMKKRIAAIRV